MLKIIDALEDAGVIIPKRVLPLTGELTEGQRLRKKKLREELARLQVLEHDHQEACRIKTERWDTTIQMLRNISELHDTNNKKIYI